MRNYSAEDNRRPSSWHGLKEAAGKAYERGDFEEALDLYQTALLPEYECAATSDRQVMLSNIVACRLKIGGEAQATAAVSDAKECIRLNPNWAKGHVRLASAYSVLKKSNDACNSLQTALRLDPGNQIARQMLVRELRRERAGPAAPLDEQQVNNVNEPSPPPPPQNPDYVPHDAPNVHNERPAPRVPNQQNRVDVEFDNGWTIRDRLQFYRTRAMLWYNRQSDETRNFIKVAVAFAFLYVAFGGRFGLESLFQSSSSSSSSSSQRMQGNYGEGNAYEQFYQERASQYNNPPRTTYLDHPRQRHHDSRGYDHYQYRGGGNNYDYTGGSSYYQGYSSDSIFGGSLPSIAILAGLAYLCHLGGVNPWQAMLLLNMGRGRGGFRGGFYGGRFRRRPGAFYW